MITAPTPRLTLLDGFALDMGATSQSYAVGILPRGVQRLVAHVGLAGRTARTAAAGRLWPEVPEEHAQGSLRTALWRLHRAAPGLVDVSGDVLALAAGVRVDVRELGEWARRVLSSDEGDGELRIPDAFLCGELLPGWYDEWVLLERERLRQLRMHTLETVAVRLAAAGRHGDALQAAYAVVREDPFRESAHRVVVRVHIAEGNLAEARRAYEQFRVMVFDELGVVPTEQMARLVCGIPPPRRAPC